MIWKREDSNVRVMSPYVLHQIIYLCLEPDSALQFMGDACVGSLYIVKSYFWS